MRPPPQRPPVPRPRLPAGRVAAVLRGQRRLEEIAVEFRHLFPREPESVRVVAVAATAAAAAAGAELVAVAVTDLARLVPVAAAYLAHVVLHLAAEVVDLVVEAVPGRLAAHADRGADGLPGGAVGDGFLDQLGFPGREVGAKGAGGAQGLEGVAVAGRRFPRLHEQGRDLAPGAFLGLFVRVVFVHGVKHALTCTVVSSAT